MKIAIIGTGTISSFVRDNLEDHDIEIAAYVVRPGKEKINKDGIPWVSAIKNLPCKIDLLIDCAGHEGLRMHAVNALEAGIDVITVSIGALADSELHTKLKAATEKCGAKLQLASGAIGALDALRAARTSKLSYVKYTGRKPPKGWLQSPAEQKIDLLNMTEAASHFKGSARDAAIEYPKNANVAAAVALSSLGFDDTTVELIADPTVESNIHEIEAAGDFGEMKFSIAGNSLPDNPRSSALAAMSVVSSLLEGRKKVTF